MQVPPMVMFRVLEKVRGKTDNGKGARIPNPSPLAISGFPPKWGNRSNGITDELDGWYSQCIHHCLQLRGYLIH